MAGEGKKREILPPPLPPLPPHPSGPTLRGPTFCRFGPPPFWAPPFVVPKFNIQKLAEVEIGRSRSPLTGDTMVVSMADCAPEKRPSVCNGVKTSLVMGTPWRQGEITDPHVECDPAPAHSRRSVQSPSNPKLQRSHTLTRGGQGRRVDGRGGEATAPGKPERRSESAAM